MQSLSSLLEAQEKAAVQATSIDTLAAKEIKKKILNVRLLPRHDEVKQFMQHLAYGQKRQVGRLFWMTFCSYNSLYHVPTAEFVDQLASEISNLGHDPAVEVCAGDGKLSYHLSHLSERGINIRATDDYSWKNPRRQRSLVQNFSCNEALKTYKPRIVIASWIPSTKPYIGLDILQFPSVEHFINIQDYKGLVLNPGEMSTRLGFRQRRLHTVERYGVCMADYCGIRPHTEVVLHTRTS